MSVWGCRLACLVGVGALAVLPAFGQSNETPNSIGVSYSLMTGSVSDVSAAEGFFQAASPGTGEIASDAQLTSAELDYLAELGAFYAPYEEADRPPAADEDFIPFSVFDPDERRVEIDTTELPARAVVQISFFVGSSPKGCTGTMIAQNVVLTAGHCVISNGEWHSDFKIFPGRNGAVAPFGSCGATDLFALDGWARPTNAADPRLYDLGAIKLDCDVGSRTGWMQIEPLESVERNATSVRGYPCDKTPAGRQWISEDEVRSELDTKVFYRNDTFGCMSGAPVFFAGSAQVVSAVHTNGQHGSGIWNENNSGTRITRERKELILSWVDKVNQ